MIKKLFLLLLFCFIISCHSMEKNGYIRPKKIETKNMTVLSNGFLYEHRLSKKIDMKYFITLRFKNINEVEGKYLIVEYQDPSKKDTFIKDIFLIRDDDKTMYLTSRKFYGFQNMRSYLIKITLTHDQYGHKVIDNFEQYTRVEFIPFGFKNEM